MFKLAVESNIGEVVVKTTENRGLAPEELAERAVEQIVSVSSSVDPVVRQQAEALEQRFLTSLFSRGIQNLLIF